MSPPERDSGVASGAHLDEEECLPFPIFIAELELLVGNSKRGKPDGVQLLELLQKLVATIPRTDKAVLKQHQRQCEAMLYDVLAHGIGAAVSRAKGTGLGYLPRNSGNVASTYKYAGASWRDGCIWIQAVLRLGRKRHR